MKRKILNKNHRENHKGKKMYQDIIRILSKLFFNSYGIPQFIGAGLSVVSSIERCHFYP